MSRKFLIAVMGAVNGALLISMVMGALTDPSFGMLKARAVEEPATGTVMMLALLFAGNAAALWFAE